MNELVFRDLLPRELFKEIPQGLHVLEGDGVFVWEELTGLVEVLDVFERLEGRNPGKQTLAFTRGN